MTSLHIAAARNAMAEAPARTGADGVLQTGYGGTVLAEAQFEKFSQAVQAQAVAAVKAESAQAAAVFGRQISEAIFDAPPDLSGAQATADLKTLKSAEPGEERLADIVGSLNELDDESTSVVDKAFLIGKLEALRAAPLQVAGHAQSVAAFAQVVNDISSQAPSGETVVSSFESVQNVERALAQDDKVSAIHEINVAINNLDGVAAAPAQALKGAWENMREATQKEPADFNSMQTAMTQVGYKLQALVEHTKEQTLDYYEDKLQASNFKEAIAARDRDPALQGAYGRLNESGHFSENVASSLVRTGLALAQQDSGAVLPPPLTAFESLPQEQNTSRGAFDQDAQAASRVNSEEASSEARAPKKVENEMELGEM